MATFTATLQELQELGWDIESDALMDYPIHDEGYRTPLNRKILDHYRFQEIGQETPGVR